jgi:hypothetical protein
LAGKLAYPLLIIIAKAIFQINKDVRLGPDECSVDLAE